MGLSAGERKRSAVINTSTILKYDYGAQFHRVLKNISSAYTIITAISTSRD